MAIMSETRAQLTETRVQIAALRAEQMKGDRDRVDRAEVRAPVSGVVKALHVSTPGRW